MNGCFVQGDLLWDLLGCLFGGSLGGRFIRGAGGGANGRLLGVPLDKVDIVN